MKILVLALAIGAHAASHGPFLAEPGVSENDLVSGYQKNVVDRLDHGSKFLFASCRLTEYTYGVIYFPLGRTEANYVQIQRDGFLENGGGVKVAPAVEGDDLMGGFATHDIQMEGINSLLSEPFRLVDYATLRGLVAKWPKNACRFRPAVRHRRGLDLPDAVSGWKPHERHVVRRGTPSQ